MNNIIPIKKGSYMPDIEIKGRTLVNLLGRAGNAIYKQDVYSKFYCSITFENDGIKIIGDGSDNDANLSSFSKGEINSLFVDGNYYIILMEATLITGKGIVSGIFGYNETITGDRYNTVPGTTKTIYTAVKASSTTYFDLVTLRTDTGVPCESIYKNIRVYEISESEYNCIKSMSNEEVVKKYPYVDDIKCVINPYIDCKENLIDHVSFYTTNFDFNGIDVNSTNNNTSSQIITSCKSGESYSIQISGELAGKISFELYNLSLESTSYDNKISVDRPDMLNTLYCTKDGMLRVFIPTNHLSDGITYNDVKSSINSGKTRFVLVKGTDIKSYDECHNSRIMFETKLYEGETISRRNDGTYVKNIIVDELKITQIDKADVGNAGTNFKEVSIYNYQYPYNSSMDIDKNDQALFKMVRYDGKIIKHTDISTDWGNIEVEQFHFGGIPVNDMRRLHLRIPNSLSGWGEEYLPTLDEIRAFFLGWRMSTPRGIQYVEGEKSWTKLWCGIGSKVKEVDGEYVIPGTHTSTCPTVMNDQGYTPYRLIYKKIDPIVEEVKTYGSLSIKEDSNVNIGSGLVLGERIPEQLHSDGLYYINGLYSLTKNRLSKTISIYDDNYSYPSIIHKSTGAEATITKGSTYTTYTGKNTVGDVLCDYLMYRPDTVTSFNYTLSSLKNANEVFVKNTQNIVNCLEELSKTKKELERTKLELSQMSNPNLLINGDFRINQRGKSEYIDHPYQYTLDRWSINNSRTKVIVKDGYVRAENYESIFATLGQTVEFTNPSKAKKLTVSFYIRNFSGDLRLCNARCYFNNTVTSILGSVVIDTPLKIGYNQFTVNIPEGVSAFTVYLYTASSNAVSTGTSFFEVEWMKAELGEYATPFIPRTYAEELAMCQRYFFKNVVYGTISTSIAKQKLISQYTPVEMRAIPTHKISYGGVVNKLDAGGTLIQCTSSQLQRDGSTCVLIVLVGGGIENVENGRPTYYELELDSEIY